MMMFCPKCGAIMMPKKVDSKVVLVCSCGHKDSGKVESLLKEAKKKGENEDVFVIEKNYTSDILVDAECSKCHHKKAYFWTIQTRASDEPETKFFKCEKCSHTWRDYN